MALLSLTEAAQRAGVTRMAVWFWIDAGRVRSVRAIIGKRRRVLRVPQEDVDAQAARVKAHGPWGPGSTARRAALAAEQVAE